MTLRDDRADLIARLGVGLAAKHWMSTEVVPALEIILRAGDPEALAKRFSHGGQRLVGQTILSTSQGLDKKTIREVMDALDIE